MVDRFRKLRPVGIGLIAVAALVAATRELKFESARPTPRPIEGPAQLDVLAQEAATPGKIIHAWVGGVDALNYQCTVQDAAVAVFTLRRSKTGADVAPLIIDAQDAAGNKFAAAVKSFGHIALISVLRGFAKKPKGVTVKLGAASLMGHVFPIEFTKISPPDRVLKAPDPKQAAEAEAIATAHVSDQPPELEVRSTLPLPSNDFIRHKILATSYLQRYPGDINPMGIGGPDISYWSDNDAVKVEVTRYRYSDKTVDLTYKDAEIVQRNGQNILWFPKPESIGTVLNYWAQLQNLWQLPRPGRTPPHPVSRGEVQIHLTSRVPIKMDLAFGDPLVVTEFLGVSPRPESMGLDSLHIVLLRPAPIPLSDRDHFYGSVTDGFDKTLVSAKGPRTPVALSIPELTIRVRVRVPVKLRSQVLVLPIHHGRGSRSAVRKAA